MQNKKIDGFNVNVFVTSLYKFMHLLSYTKWIQYYPKHLVIVRRNARALLGNFTAEYDQFLITDKVERYIFSPNSFANQDF